MITALFMSLALATTPTTDPRIVDEYVGSIRECRMEMQNKRLASAKKACMQAFAWATTLPESTEGERKVLANVLHTLNSRPAADFYASGWTE